MLRGNGEGITLMWYGLAFNAFKEFLREVLRIVPSDAIIMILARIGTENPGYLGQNRGWTGAGFRKSDHGS